MFIDTAKQHLKERGTFTEAELKALAELTPHRAEQSTNAFQVELEAMADGVVRESDRWMEELLCSSLTSFEEGMDPVQKRTRVAQLILERAQTQCMTCGKAGRSVEQQCLSCYQQTGRMNTGEDVTDATNSIVIPVILRSAGAPENAHHYCRTEDVLCNISDSWRKEIEEICGVDTPRAREVALCMIRTVVTEPTPVLQAVWLDQFLEFERMNGGDEWWCECLQLVGTDAQRSDAAMDTIDEVIHGVKRMLKQLETPFKGECENCGFKGATLCFDCKVCSQCCGCHDGFEESNEPQSEINVEGLCQGAREMHEKARCDDVFHGMMNGQWLPLAVEKKLRAAAEVTDVDIGNNTTNGREKMTTANMSDAPERRTPDEMVAEEVLLSCFEQGRKEAREICKKESILSFRAQIPLDKQKRSPIESRYPVTDQRYLDDWRMARQVDQEERRRYIIEVERTQDDAQIAKRVSELEVELKTTRPPTELGKETQMTRAIREWAMDHKQEGECVQALRHLQGNRTKDKGEIVQSRDFSHEKNNRERPMETPERERNQVTRIASGAGSDAGFSALGPHDPLRPAGSPVSNDIPIEINKSNDPQVSYTRRVDSDKGNGQQPVFFYHKDAKGSERYLQRLEEAVDADQQRDKLLCLSLIHI